MRWITAILAGTMLAGCGPKDARPVVKIGFASPLTGDVAAMGLGMRNGALLAVEEANASGQFPNLRVELLAVDDRSDPKEAVNVANQLVSDPRVVAVVGHLNSGCSIPAARVYNRHGLAMITPASTNPKLTRQQDDPDWGVRNVFRVCTTDDVQGEFAGRFVAKRLKLRRVAVIHDKTPYGQGLVEEFQKEFARQGGTVISFEGIAIGDKDFKPLLTRVKGLNPQAIYFGGLYTEAGLVTRQAKELGFTGPMITGDGVYSPEFMKVGGTATEGDIVTLVGAPPEKIPSGQAFLDKYRARFPGVDAQPYDPYTYDAVNIVLAAVASVGTDKAKVMEHIRAIRFQGVLGDTRFDPRGDTLNKIITPYLVKSGKFVVYE